MSVNSPVPGPGTLKKNERGHNLLEVIVASFVFCTVSVLFTSVWAQQYRQQAVSRNHLTASSLGRQVLEEHLAAGYTASPVGVKGPFPVVSKTRIRGNDADCAFNYTVTVNEYPLPPMNPEFKEIRVEVTWQDTTGNKKLNYATYMYRTQ